MEIDTLIEKIIPLYNLYRSQSNQIIGVEALKIMWDIGDLLKGYLDENDIAPHALYRQIYGKGEGTKNVVQKSYITREFLSRSYRIRNIFKDKKESVKKDLEKCKQVAEYRWFGAVDDFWVFFLIIQHHFDPHRNQGFSFFDKFLKFFVIHHLKSL